MSIDKITKTIELKVGDYVRNKYGIAKIIEIKEEHYTHKPLVIFDRDICFIKNNKTNEEKRINQIIITDNIDISKIKFSSNIIDLIEYGDIIGWKTKYNGGVNEVVGDKEPSVYATEEDRYVPLSEIEIVSIITHEKIQEVEYKIER